MTATLPPEPGADDEFDHLNDIDLEYHRIELLRQACLSCDRSQFQAPCTCDETEAEIERIEAEQARRRGGD